MKAFAAAAMILGLTVAALTPSVAQTSAPTTPSLAGTSPLNSGTANSIGMQSNPANGSATLTNSSQCAPSAGTLSLPTFDGGGLSLGSMAPQGAAVIESNLPSPCSTGMDTSQSITLPGGTTLSSTNASAALSSSSANATGTVAAPAATTPPAPSPSTSDTGMNLGTGALGAGGLGAVGLGSVTAQTTATSQGTTSLAATDAAAAACAATSGMIAGSAMDGEQNSSVTASASGTVADPAESVGSSLPDPAQSLGGTATVPAVLAPSCPPTP
jgi:hypothetical protein